MNEDNHIIRIALRNYADASIKFHHNKLARRCKELMKNYKCDCGFCKSDEI